MIVEGTSEARIDQTQVVQQAFFSSATELLNIADGMEINCQDEHFTNLREKYQILILRTDLRYFLCPS